MKDKWAELHYVDLFAGAGFARYKSNQQLAFSSALLAARVRFPFTQLHLCDAEPKNTYSLAQRLKAYPQPREPRVLTGDANAMIHELLDGVPMQAALCMTFADPFGLHLDFDTVKAIATRKSDLVILVADNMDALRNWATYYYNNPQSTLDRFMGESGWRDVLLQAPSDRIAERVRERYKDQLRSLGYTQFHNISVQNSSDRDIYTLLYASRSAAGLKIWRGTSLNDETGQMGLNF